MGYRPPKGVKPPQLEGKRSGRPKGSKSFQRFWDNVLWGYEHRDHEPAACPNQEARIWWFFAFRYPEEVEEFLEAYRKL